MKDYLLQNSYQLSPGSTSSTTHFYGSPGTADRNSVVSKHPASTACGDSGSDRGVCREKNQSSQQEQVAEQKDNNCIHPSSMPYHDRIIVYFDGASRNNPHGPAGCGWIMYEMDCYGAEGDFIARGRKYLGYNVSNNQAEYRALDDALDYMYHSGISCHGLYIRGDSEIVIKQLEGTYQVRSSNIIPDYNQVRDSLGYVDHSFVRFTHIDRYKNSEADALANDAIENEESYISE